MRVAILAVSVHHLVGAVRHRRVAQRALGLILGIRRRVLIPQAVGIGRQPVVGALEAPRLRDGLLRIAAIVVALEADMRTGGRQIRVLAAPQRVGQMDDVGVAPIVLPVNRTRQQQLRLGRHIDAVRAAALVAPQAIRGIDMPVAQARVAPVAGGGTVAIRIEAPQAAASRQTRRYGGDALVIRLRALLHFQLLAGARGALGVLGGVANIALQGLTGF